MGVRITVSQFECWIPNKNAEKSKTNQSNYFNNLFTSWMEFTHNLNSKYKHYLTSKFERVWNKIWEWSHPWHILFVISIDSLKHQVIGHVLRWDKPGLYTTSPNPFTIFYYIPIYNDYRGKYNNSGTFSSYHIIYHGMLCQRGENIKIIITLGAWEVEKYKSL